MKHLYLFTLEITPLEIGRVYDELPSHLTLMSRFLSHFSPDELTTRVRPLFAGTSPVHLAFGKTKILGPKKVTAHMVASTDERRLHNNLRKLLDGANVEYQYPEFIGDNHKPHVTAREGVQFVPGSTHTASAVYLIEVVDKKRVVRAKFTLSAA
ncbi:MAG TPA: 2'-5' RNA ligase family protein [Candidatus Saccharimonadales bacterium]|nr:2'-5' RNA ligase family protein [Candidatus Saccharimonadales bacterium]